MFSFVEKKKGILGAFPDGLVTDPSNPRSPHGIIEAKTAIVMDGETLKDALIRKSIQELDVLLSSTTTTLRREQTLGCPCYTWK